MTSGTGFIIAMSVILFRINRNLELLHFSVCFRSNLQRFARLTLYISLSSYGCSKILCFCSIN